MKRLSIGMTFLTRYWKKKKTQERVLFFFFLKTVNANRLQMNELLPILRTDQQCSYVLLIPPLTSTLPFLPTSADLCPSNGFQQTRVWKWGASRWRRTNEGLTGQLDCSMSFRSHIFSRCSRSFSSCSLVLRSLSSFFSLSSVASISHLQKTAAEKKKKKFFSQTNV